MIRPSLAIPAVVGDAPGGRVRAAARDDSGIGARTERHRDESTAGGRRDPAPGGGALGEPVATPVRPAPREFVAIPELRDIHFDFDKYGTSGLGMRGRSTRTRRG